MLYLVLHDVTGGAVLQDDVRRFLSVLREPGGLSARQHVAAKPRQDVERADDSRRVGAAAPRRRMHQQQKNISQQPAGTDAPSPHSVHEVPFSLS